MQAGCGFGLGEGAGGPIRASREIALAEAKTKPTGASVEVRLDAIENESRRKGCKELAAPEKRVTGRTPRMWGPGIVSFGSYRYECASGQSGDACQGFADVRLPVPGELSARFAAETRRRTPRPGSSRS